MLLYCLHAYSDRRYSYHSAGAIPWGLNHMEQLVPLNYIEQQLVSLYCVHRILICMKPATKSKSDAFGNVSQLCHRGHVIATPNVGADKVRDCLLMHPDALADVLQVVFLVLVRTDDPAVIDAAVRKMCQRSPALRIRGLQVVKWACYMCDVSVVNQRC